MPRRPAERAAEKDGLYSPLKREKRMLPRASFPLRVSCRRGVK